MSDTKVTLSGLTPHIAAIVKQMAKLINTSVDLNCIVPISDASELMAQMKIPTGKSVIVLIRTTRGQTPSRQVIGRGIDRDAAIGFAKVIYPLLPMGAWFAVEAQ